MFLRVSACVFTTMAVLATWPSTVVAQQALPSGARSTDGLWQAGTDANVAAAQRRATTIRAYSVQRLNRPAFIALLGQAPLERTGARPGASPLVIELPLPDGRYSRFRIEESPILDPALAAAFPDIKTYRGSGVDDPTATVRFDITPNGFHAQIIAAGGTVLIDPYTEGDLVNHVAYDKGSAQRPERPVDEVLEDAAQDLPRTYNQFPITHGTTLRTYRLALAATGEYTAAAGGTKSAAVSRITTTMNRVNGIYEREVAVRLTVATGTPSDATALIYTSPTTDPYTNNDGAAMLAQNQSTVDSIVGSANYDIGHVFSTGGGGIAGLGVVCNGFGWKARGVTGLPNPTGDVFAVDYVSHEMGHQFGANHTFNSPSGSCGGNRSTAHAYEVGSGSTIMGYSGICSPENTQINSTDIFTVESLNEITAFITNGGGLSCGTASATGNSVPVVTAAGTSFTIPASTPFELTASATDANGDSLTYLWEQYDRNNLSSPSTFGWDDGVSPLFRSYSPTSSPTRSFPSLSYILSYGNVPPLTSGSLLVGELLPSTNRTLTFQVVVRDNRAGGGAISTAQTLVTVNAGTGPFAVSAPNTSVSWPALSTQTVTWSVNGSNTLAAHVAILLSTDGGSTFPVTILASTPNDGSQTITVPQQLTSTARIKIQAVGNIFFDVSNANFTITAPVAPPGASAKSAPANGATGQSLSPTVSWSAVSGAASYEFCVDTFANAYCDTAWVSVGTSTSTVLGGLKPATTYQWQIRAVNASASTLADSGTWWSFTTGAGPTNRFADLAVDFGSSLGLWLYYDGGTWRQLHTLSPTKIAVGDVDGNGRSDLAMAFAGAGIWLYVNDSGWLQLSPYEVSNMVLGDLDGNGRDEVVVAFVGAGTWARYDNGSFVQLSTLTAGAMAVGNMDSPGGKAELIVGFPGQGTWIYRNDAAWSQLNGVTATVIATGDLDANGQADLVLQFGSSGAYIYYDDQGWVHLHPYVASGYAIGNVDNDPGGKDDVIVNLPGAGAYAYLNGGAWSQIHPLIAPVMATATVTGTAQSQVLLGFTGAGLWQHTVPGGWNQLHPVTPEAVLGGRFNGN